MDTAGKGSRGGSLEAFLGGFGIRGFRGFQSQCSAPPFESCIPLSADRVDCCPAAVWRGGRMAGRRQAHPRRAARARWRLAGDGHHCWDGAAVRRRPRMRRRLARALPQGCFWQRWHRSCALLRPLGGRLATGTGWHGAPVMARPPPKLVASHIFFIMGSFWGIVPRLCVLLQGCHMQMAVARCH